MAVSVAAGVFVDFGFENGVFYGALHKEFVYVPASHIIKNYSPRIRLVFAPPKAKLFDITVEIF